MSLVHASITISTITATFLQLHIGSLQSQVKSDFFKNTSEGMATNHPHADALHKMEYFVNGSVCQR